MIQRLTDFYPQQLEEHPLEVCLAGKYNGQWKVYSTREVIEECRALGKGLLSIGFPKGSRIGLIANNRPEWNFADQAILLCGHINVPIYPTITDEDYRYILTHADLKLLFISSKELAERIQGICAGMDSPPAIYTFDKVPGFKHWTEIKALSQTITDEQLEEVHNSVKGEDLATIIYTSGTTGNPKGVMLSHNNIVSNVIGSSPRVPISQGERAVSFLPLCHIYERMIHYLMVERCISIWYAESMETIGENIKEVKPHVFSAVPRVLEKVYDKIIAKGHDLTGIKKALFFWAVNLGLKYELGGKNGAWYEFQLKLANKLIFSKWREALGGETRAIVSGAAALQPRLARVFWAAGIHVLEGYGLTETSPVVAVNYLKANQVGFGTVGSVLENVQVKIADDGEILCKGPNVMIGYYREPELTAQVLDHEGWFHTGDIGEFTPEGYLKITDRKKEIFKTSGGKYIAPQVMENKFKESLIIEQIMVVGESKNYPAAIISPSWDNLKVWCKEHEIAYTKPEEMIKHPAVIKKFEAEVEKYNQFFGQWEKIKRFELVPVSWTVETGELTPTMKLKRRAILSKHLDIFEKLYS